MKACPVGLPDPDVWLSALHTRPSWLADRLPLSPESDDDLRTRLAHVDRLDTDRQALVAALESQADSLGADERSHASIERLRDPRAVVIVTGQQVGALLGPLYTIAKAAGAVAFAREIEARTGRPVVPVFWAATEDHDVGEVNRVRVPAPGGGRCDFHLFDPVPSGREPVGNRSIVREMPALIEAIRASEAPAGPHRDEVLDLAQALVKDHPTLGTHFGALLAAVFQGSGLVIMDPMDPALRRLSASVLSRAVDDHRAVSEAIRQGIERLVASGETVQVPWDERELGVFTIVGGQRLRLCLDGAKVYPRGHSDLADTAKAWASRALTDPEQFSPNVLLRPIVQDTLLPTLAVVLGPGETRYFGELKELFELFDREVPPILARPRITLISGTADKLLRRLDLSVESVVSGDCEARLRAILSERDEIGIDERFAQFEETVKAAQSALLEALAPLGSAIQEFGIKTEQKMLSEVHWLRAKTEQAHRQGNETMIRQYKHLSDHLRPEGMPQERQFGCLGYLAQWGITLGSDLAVTPDLTKPGPLAVHLTQG